MGMVVAACPKESVGCHIHAMSPRCAAFCRPSREAVRFSSAPVSTWSRPSGLNDSIRRDTTMSIKQQAMIPANPAQVYAVLADAAALSALSGMPGAPGRSAGEEFSAFDGHVTGRQIEFVPGERIVQAWRFPVWAPGTYSIVRLRSCPRPAARAWSSTSTASRKTGTTTSTPIGRPSTSRRSRTIFRSRLSAETVATRAARRARGLSPAGANIRAEGDERMTADEALLDRARSGDADAFDGAD